MPSPGLRVISADHHHDDAESMVSGQRSISEDSAEAQVFGD